MKTLVSFHIALAAIIKANGNDLDQVTNACQGAMNSAQAVEGGAKRGAVTGGQSRNADGTLKVKDLAWTETQRLDYAVKYTAPVEFVKFNDALVNLFKKCGEPTGDLTIAIVPLHLREWLDKMKEGKKAAAKAAKLEGAPKREDKPAKSNGHAEPATV